jgi:hypothetical protein
LLRYLEVFQKGQLSRFFRSDQTKASEAEVTEKEREKKKSRKAEREKKKSRKAERERKGKQEKERKLKKKNSRRKSWSRGSRTSRSRRAPGSP